MNLETHYNKLYRNSIAEIRANRYILDKNIESPDDTRRGLTLLIRPNEEAKNIIQSFLSQLKVYEPKQYYYPDTDIHITVMSIISCYAGFDINIINIEDYISIIQQSLENIKKFKIKFRGITASPSCIMIQGFMQNDTLNILRSELRKRFGKSMLEQSLDKRYTIQTAHATVIRFKEELSNTEDFVSTIEKYKNHYFGTFDVEQLKFVYNDWYQRKELTKTLHTFKL